VPIIKKSEREKLENYRGVTLMSLLYKIYVIILANRLREVMEEKSILSGNQAAFQKGMGTIDQIYILNYSINR